MNKVILIGNICNDVTLRQTPTGTSVLANTIAVRRKYKNQQGEYDSDFINFAAYRVTAELIAQYFTKGARIGLEGTWQTRTYTKEDGTKAYVNELQVENIEFLQAKKETPSEPTYQEYDNSDLPF